MCVVINSVGADLCVCPLTFFIKKSSRKRIDIFILNTPGSIILKIIMCVTTLFIIGRCNMQAPFSHGAERECLKILIIECLDAGYIKGIGKLSTPDSEGCMFPVCLESRNDIQSVLFCLLNP